MQRKFYWRKKLVGSDSFLPDSVCRGNRDLIEVAEDDELQANLVSSLADDGFHYPALDIDVPHRYVPSSTPGHGHLYFDATPLSWEQYEVLLEALGKAQIIGSGYLRYAKLRKMTLLRHNTTKQAEVTSLALAKRYPELAA